MPSEAEQLGLPGHCAHCPVRALTVYGGVRSDEAEAIFRMRRDVRQVQARRDICRQGDPITEFLTLYSGWAFRYTVLPEGSRQILSFILPGESLGLATLSAERMDYSVQALTDVTVCVLDREEIADYMARNPDVGRHLQREIQTYQHRCDRRIAEMGRRNGLQRVASLIADTQARLKRRAGAADSEFPFPPRQSHVADAVGLTSIHVSRIFGELEATGILRRIGRRIRVLDQSALERLATTTISARQ